MRLVKFCESKDNVRRGAKLLLGNLRKYRKIDYKDLRDAGEGTYSFLINFNGEVRLRKDLFNTLFHGNMSFGNQRISIPFAMDTVAIVKRMTLIREEEEFVVVRDASVEIRMDFPNRLIFCMSKVEGDIGNPFSGYDDHWDFDFSQANNFADRLSRLVAAQFPLGGLDVPGINFAPLSKLYQIRVVPSHKPVIYADRELNFTNADIPSPETLVSKYFDACFVKPTSYSGDFEYRFVIDLILDGMVLSVKEQDLFLNLNSLVD